MAKTAPPDFHLRCPCCNATSNIGTDYIIYILLFNVFLPYTFFLTQNRRLLIYSCTLMENTLFVSLFDPAL